jgi:hypothetical protein
MMVQEHLALLGKPVTDKVTGFTGVVTSVSFDLYGCIQAVVTPYAGKDGQLGEPRWFDVPRALRCSATIRSWHRRTSIPGISLKDARVLPKSPAASGRSERSSCARLSERAT